MRDTGMKTHVVFDAIEGNTLRGYHGMEGKRTDPKAVTVDILRDRGRYRVGEYVVVEHDWAYELPGFEGHGPYELTPEVRAVVKIVTVSIGHDDFRAA